MTDTQFIDAWVAPYGGPENGNPGWTMPANEYFSAWRPDRMYYSFKYDYTGRDEHLHGDGSLDSEENQEEEKEETVEDERSGWRLKDIKRIGMDVIKKKEDAKEDEEEKKKHAAQFTVLTPSDHYGLLA